MLHKLYALRTDMRGPVSLDAELLRAECEKWLEIVRDLEKTIGVDVGLRPEWPQLFFLFEDREDRKKAWWYLRKVVEPLEIVVEAVLVDEAGYRFAFGKA